MTPIGHSVRVVLLALVVVLLGSAPAPARAHDIPDQIVVHLFARPEGERLDVLVRVPLVLLLNVDLPKRGPGYLDLAQIDPALEEASHAVARDVTLFENGAQLRPDRVRGRISILSDRSFESFEQAVVHVEALRLAEDTNVFWDQGFLDVKLEYPIRSDRADFALESHMAPEVQKRLHVVARLIQPDGVTRTYDLAGDFGRVTLDPRWYQAAATFTRLGFLHILTGIDHLLFLLLVVLPFPRGRVKALLTVVTSFTVAHSVTLIAAAYGLVPGGDWFQPLVEALIAASIVFMAVENIVGAQLNRRWIVTGGFGLVHGFGFASGLTDSFQLAGDHLLASLFAFNVGIELGQVLVVVGILAVRNVLFDHVISARLGVIVGSAVAAHSAWHWLEERTARLQYLEWPPLDLAAVAVVSRWLLVLLVIGGIAWQLARLVARHSRVPIQELAGRLHRRAPDANPPTNSPSAGQCVSGVEERTTRAPG